MTARPDGIRLVVGAWILLTLQRGKLWIAFQLQGLKEGDRTRLERELEEWTPQQYERIGAASGYLSAEQLPRLLPILKPAHEQLIRTASMYELRSGSRAAHDEGVIEYLMDFLGRTLPVPAYIDPEAAEEDEVQESDDDEGPSAWLFQSNPDNFDLCGAGILVVSFLAIPITLTLAMLRARLWEVDVVINRALVYSALIGTLALAYGGSVLLLLQLFHDLTGVRDGLALSGATVVIALLFQPLRTRIRTLIDRRFYRHKYDAAQTLASFSAHLRDEVDLEHLTADVVAVVEATMQPAHVSLWLRPPAAWVERAEPVLPTAGAEAEA